MPYFADASITGTGGATITSSTPDTGTAYTHVLGTMVILGGGVGARAGGTVDPCLTAVAPSPGEADHQFSHSFRLDTANGTQCGAVIEYTAGPNWYMLTLTTGGAVTLTEVVGGTGTALDTAMISVSAGNIYNLAIRRVGNTITGYVDDVEVVSFADASPRSAGASGIWIDARTFAVADNTGWTALANEGLNGSELASGPTVVFSEPVLAEEDESGAASASVTVRTAAAAVEDEAGAASARVVVHTSAAAVEDEVTPEPPDTTIYVRTAADAVEDEVASATGGSNPPGIVFSEPVLAVEDESASAAARVLVHSGAGAEEEESAAASAWARVFSSAAAVEDEVADVVEPDLYRGPLSATVTGWRPRLSATIRRS